MKFYSINNLFVKYNKIQYSIYQITATSKENKYQFLYVHKFDKFEIQK